MIKKTFRISDEEDTLLKTYCQQKEKTENQVVRELIAKLKNKTAPKGGGKPPHACELEFDSSSVGGAG